MEGEKISIEYGKGRCKGRRWESEDVQRTLHSENYDIQINKPIRLCNDSSPSTIETPFFFKMSQRQTTYKPMSPTANNISNKPMSQRQSTLQAYFTTANNITSLLLSHTRWASRRACASKFSSEMENRDGKEAQQRSSEEVKLEW